MATTTGTESAFGTLIEDLIYLEYDAIAAYDSSIEKLESPQFKSQITSFRADHHQHLATLQEIARELTIKAPTEGDMKQMLTTGKVAIASLMGDTAILKAMKTNEDDTVAAYERASHHEDAHMESRAFFSKALVDEERHRDWMQTTAANHDKR